MRTSVPLLAPGATICGEPSYTHPTHAALPHIVKFSGGRSSAAMVLSLARGGVLDPDRGDLVLFANTTAEHPATYDFAARVCDDLEQRHAVPCLWYEFCTVEEAAKTGWIRKTSYRLVRRTRGNDTDDPTTPGYDDDGGAFEELASLKRMLPNRSLRFCTQHLKILPGIKLIAEWLGGGPGPAAAGHHHGRPLTSAAIAAERYNGDRLSDDEVAEAAAFVHSRPWMRPAQRWEDFTAVSGDRTATTARRVADLSGRTGPAVRYVTLLGLRSDEPERVNRAHFDAMLADGADDGRCRHDSHPAGEIVATPLHDSGADSAAVETFWQQQPYDLGIDRALGNCVYCFMKGEPALRRLSAAEQASPDTPAGPASIGWWADIEARYAGPSDDPTARRFKFLTLRSSSYADIADGAAPDNSLSGASLPCACTD